MGRGRAADAGFHRGRRGSWECENQAGSPSRKKIKLVRLPEWEGAPIGGSAPRPRIGIVSAQADHRPASLPRRTRGPRNGRAEGWWATSNRCPMKMPRRVGIAPPPPTCCRRCHQQLLSIARQKMRRESPEQTLQPTALVHEEYFRVVGADSERMRDSRWHFMAAADAMRRILVERARRRRSIKHGGAFRRTDLGDVTLEVDGHPTDLLTLDDALTKLAERHPEKAKLVKLRFFADLTADEAAQTMGLSDATTDRYWAFAKAWLFREVGQ